ncbi:mannose-6-phosphate isomerase [Cytophagaceae bacterium ABcell3]|nr:mannose-6-phosphate isomerase [Cytophagaceae bacterium ABcell3]
MSELYPLLFSPIFKEKIWGGNKLKSFFDKDCGNLPNCGESWEISGVEGNISIVKEGPFKGKSLAQLIEEHQERLVGNKVYKRFGTEFPLLIKFLDASEDLSIQVHPDDNLARQKHGSLGKTEMWYILQADEGARLNTGFSKQVDRKTFMEHVNNNTLEEILNYEEVKEGDVFFLPAGRIHYIGKGICLAEIQQTSDVTYRVYDFGRKDSNGNTRELHVEDAVDALDFKVYDQYKSHYEAELDRPVNIVECPYFTTNLLEAAHEQDRDYSKLDSFVIYIILDGKVELATSNGTFDFQKGDTVLLPAECDRAKLVPKDKVKMLEVYIS